MSQELFDAINQGAKARVLAMLAEQPDLVNCVFDNKQSAFELALERGYTSLAKSLIDLPGFDLDLPGHNPIRAAVLSGYEDIGAILLEKGANPNYNEKNIGCILQICLENGCFYLAEKALEQGAEIDVRDDRGWTMLMTAAHGGQEDIVDFLLEHHASVNTCTKDGWNALAAAYAKNETGIAQKLERAGARLNGRHAQAALISAFENGHLQTAQALLEQGVRPDIRDKKYGTFLNAAVSKGDYAFIKKLLEYGADPNAKGEDGRPPIILLAKNGCDDLITLFADHGADINLPDQHGRTSIIAAAVNNQIETVKLLKTLGANINAQDDDGWTALMFAVKEHFVSMTQTLIKLGANLELINKEGKKAESYICLNRNGQSDGLLEYLFKVKRH